MLASHCRRAIFNNVRRSFSSLVVAEQFEGKLADNVTNVVGAASQFGEDVHVLLHGKDPESQLDGLSKISGISKVILAKHDDLENPTATDLANVAQKALTDGGYKRLLTPSTNFGKDFLPRIAGKIDSQPITDVIKIESENTFQRPVYSGNLVSTVESHDDIKLITVRSTNFDASPEGALDAPTEELDVSDCVGTSGYTYEFVDNIVEK